jgi:methionyl-tRNA formyltransferase
MNNKRIVFMGTPEFALESLKALVTGGYKVVAVYTRAPKPAGRGHKEQKSPVHRYADSAGIPVLTPKTLKTESEQRIFRDLKPDLAVVAAYGLILPPAVLEAPAHGCINIHASILPRWRGAAPIHRAILAGDPKTGITFMRMDAGLDTGDRVKVVETPVYPDDTTQTLHDRLAGIGAAHIGDVVGDWMAGRISAAAQPADGVTYAAKVEKEEARIDWTKPASEIDRRIRAFTPFPGAWTTCRGERLKILTVRPVSENVIQKPGTVLNRDLAVSCGVGYIKIVKLQRSGKSPQDADTFLRGFPIQKDEVLGDDAV